MSCSLFVIHLALLSAYTEDEIQHLTAETVWAQIRAANRKAEGSNFRPAMSKWKEKASATWNRIRIHVLPSSMVNPVRLFVTAQLAYNSIAVPGDFVETGVAHGGSTILMMAVLDDSGASSQKKHHFACDSFDGLPYGVPQDFSKNNNCSVTTRGTSGAQGCGHARGNNLKEASVLKDFRGQYRFPLRVFRDAVKSSKVSQYRLRIIEGWFNNTLPPVGLRAIAFLRLDGDLYESTRDAISALYPLVSVGGAVYVDDYGAYGGCRLAVDEYRERNKISTPLVKVWQNFTPRVGGYVTPQAKAGYGFEAAWWIKE